MNGQGTNAIKVKFGNSSGNVSVYLSDGCGNTTTTSLVVTVGGALAAQTALSLEAAKGHLEIYPNPTNSIATIVFDAKKGSKYQIVVTDVIGKPVIKTSGIGGFSKNTIQLNMNDQANGTYFITLITKDATRTAKLYKEK